MIRAALLAVMALTPAACQRAKSPPSAEDRPAAPAEPSRQPATAAPAAKPRIKAPAVVARQRLGTLPEGVGLPVGSRVPNVTVKTHLGETVQLEQLVKTGPLMLIFYRGGW